MKLTVPGRCARRHVYNYGRTEGILPLVLFPCELWIRCLGLNYKSHTRDLGAGLENETFGRRTNIETNPLIWRPFYILTICVPKIFVMKPQCFKTFIQLFIVRSSSTHEVVNIRLCLICQKQPIDQREVCYALGFDILLDIGPLFPKFHVKSDSANH